MINDKCIIFEYKGKFAHFLKAEANASAPSYPFPTRTILLGLVGAVLGLTKDSPQIFLKNTKIAVSGKAEAVHWHTANLRKDPPALLSKIIKKSDKGTSKAQRNTIIAQEWLFKPEFIIFAQLPEEYHDNFDYRIRNKKWHFTPCLGLSEMMADLNFVDSIKIEQLEEGIYNIETPARKSEVEFDMKNALEQNFVVKSIRMPRDLTEKREFSHETYLYEASGNALYLKTANACKVGNSIISWL